LLNEIKVTCLPSFDGTRVVFLPSTAYGGASLDETKRRWSEMVQIVGGEQPLRISIALVCCF
jgi:hypothetical protein